MSVRPSPTPRGRRPPPPSNGRPAVAVGVPVLLPPLGALSVHGPSAPPPSRPRPEDYADTDVNQGKALLDAVRAGGMRALRRLAGRRGPGESIQEQNDANEQQQARDDQNFQREVQQQDLNAQQAHAAQLRANGTIDANQATKAGQLAAKKAATLIVAKDKGLGGVQLRLPETPSERNFNTLMRAHEQRSRAARARQFEQRRMLGPTPAEPYLVISQPVVQAAGPTAGALHRAEAETRAQVRQAMALCQRAEANQSEEQAAEQLRKMWEFMNVAFEGSSMLLDHREKWVGKVHRDMIVHASYQIRALNGVELDDGTFQGGAVMYGDAAHSLIEQKKALMQQQVMETDQLQHRAETHSGVLAQLLLQLGERVQDVTELAFIANNSEMDATPWVEQLKGAEGEAVADSAAEITKALVPELDAEVRALLPGTAAGERRLVDDGATFRQTYPNLETDPGLVTGYLDQAVERALVVRNAYLERKLQTEEAARKWQEAIRELEFRKGEYHAVAAQPFGSIEQDRRIALATAVRQAAFVREGDDEDGTGWHASKDVGTWWWQGRRMRKPAPPPQTDGMGVPTWMMARRDDEKEPELRTLEEDCAYETLLWYFGGDPALERAPTEYRKALIEMHGRRAVGVAPETPASEIDAYTQAKITAAGMRHFCLGMDSLILCTKDKVHYHPDKEGNVVSDYDVNNPQPDTDDYRSEEWRKAYSLLCFTATRYCAQVCHNAGHNEVYVKADGTRAYHRGMAPLPSELTDIAFDMPGQEVKGMTSATFQRFAPPFSWEQTVWLSKLFSFVEALARGVVPTAGNTQRSGQDLARQRGELRAGMETGTRETRRKYADGKMLNPHEWQELAKRLKCLADAPNVDTDTDGAVLAETDFEGQSRAWTVGMEIEANPHAAALWTVLLFKLLTIRVKNRPDHLVEGEIAMQDGGIDEHATYGVMNNLFRYAVQQGLPDQPSAQDKETQKIMQLGEDDENSIPNTVDAWILTHPAVQLFQETPMGKYMLEVFQTVKFSWAVHESRILELACVWGHRQLGVQHANTDRSTAMAPDEEHMKIVKRHSALNKVIIQDAALTTSVFSPMTAPDLATAADLYYEHFVTNLQSRQASYIDWYDVWRRLQWVTAAAVSATHLVFQTAALPAGQQAAFLFKTGFDAIYRMNAPAKAVLAATFKGALQKYAPEKSQALDSFLVQGAVGLGKTAAEAISLFTSGLTGTGSVMATITKQLVTDLKILPAEHRFLAQLETLSTLLGEGPEALYKMFEEQLQALGAAMKEKGEQAAEAFRDARRRAGQAYTQAEEEAAQLSAMVFNWDPAVSLQGFMDALVTLNLVGEPKVIVIQDTQWESRYDDAAYKAHVAMMTAPMYSGGQPVRWKVKASLGSPNSDFEWYDTLTFRYALFTYRRTDASQPMWQKVAINAADVVAAILRSISALGLHAAGSLQEFGEFVLYNDPEVVWESFGQFTAKSTTTAGIGAFKRSLATFKGSLKGMGASVADEVTSHFGAPIHMQPAAPLAGAEQCPVPGYNALTGEWEGPHVEEYPYNPRKEWLQSAADVLPSREAAAGVGLALLQVGKTFVGKLGAAEQRVVAAATQAAAGVAVTAAQQGQRLQGGAAALGAGPPAAGAAGPSGLASSLASGAASLMPGGGAVRRPRQ